MIRTIVKEIVPYIDALNFADLTAGVVTVATKNQMSENGTVNKIFPIYENTPDECNGGDYLVLIPDEKYRAIIYFEELGNTITSQTNYEIKISSDIRLIGWFNLKNIGASVTSDVLLRLIAQAIPETLADFGDIENIQISLTGIPNKSTTLFSQYTYNEAERQYLLFPFDYGALNYTVTYSLNKCVDDIVPEINCGKRNSGGTPVGGCIISNSNDTYVESLNCGQNLELPDISFTDSDGTVMSVPAETNIVATPCGCDDPAIVQNSDGSYETSVDCCDTLTLPDSTISNSDNSYNYSLPATENHTVPDSVIENSDGSYNVSVPAAQPLVVPDTNISNSDNSFNVDTPSTIAYEISDITITKGDGSTISYPAAKDYTEDANEGFIYTLFQTTYDMNYTHTVPAEEAGIYDTEALVNVATVVYKVNTVVKTLPITLVAGDVFLITVTQTNAALNSSVKISY